MKKIIYIMTFILFIIAKPQAKIYWLPDYLGQNADYPGRTNKDGQVSEIPSICESRQRPKTDLYDFDTELQDAIYCYNNIHCKPKFKFDSSSCSTEYNLEGDSCNGLYERCEPKECSEGGYYKTTQTGMHCSPQPYAGRTCQNCVTDPCYNLKDFDTPYGCEQTYVLCNTKCQSPYPDNCHNHDSLDCQHGCESYFDDCAEKCKTCKTPNNIGKVYVRFTEINCKKEAIPAGNFMEGRHKIFIHANIKCVDNNGNEFWNREDYADYGALVGVVASAPDISYCERYKYDSDFINDSIYNSMDGGCSYEDSGLTYCTKEYFIKNYINQHGLWVTKYYQRSGWMDCDGNNSSSYVTPFGYNDLYEKY